MLISGKNAEYNAEFGVYKELYSLLFSTKSFFLKRFFLRRCVKKIVFIKWKTASLFSQIKWHCGFYVTSEDETKYLV